MYARTLKKGLLPFVVLLSISLLIAACTPPEAEIVEKVVTQVVTQVVMETVKETVVVEGTPQVVEKEVTKVVEVIVTPTPEPTPEPIAAESSEPVFGGVLNFGWNQVPPSLDEMCTVAYTSRFINQHILETIVAFGEDYTVVPMLAESWDISDDNLTYTFHLRRGVKFHNGKEMTSADVIASMDRFLEVTTRASSFEILESYEATDDYTIVMHISRPSATFLGALATPSSTLVILPKEIIEGRPAGDLKPADIIGTGPYYLDQEEFKADEVIVLKRFEDYQPLEGERDGFGGAKIAYFDEIRIHIIPEDASRMAALEVGDLDISQPPASEIERIKTMPDLKAAINLNSQGWYLWFNGANQFSGDVKFRQAILAALDIESLAMAATGGATELYTLNESIWPKETVWYFEDPYALAQYNQNDPEKAKQLLEEAGYAGEEIVIITQRIEAIYRAMIALADQLENKLGMKVKVEVMDYPSYLARAAEEDSWHIGWMAWTTMEALNPNWASAAWTCAAGPPWNPHYCNPEMDEAFVILEQATNLEERKEALKEVQRVFWEDLPNIKLFELHQLWVTQDDIFGFKPWYLPRMWGVWRQQ